MRRRMMRPARIAPMAAVPLAALLIGVVLALPLHLQPDASRMCSGAAGVGIVHAQTTDECTDPTVPPPTVPPPTVPPPTVPPPTVPPPTVPPPTVPPPTVPPTASPTVPPPTVPPPTVPPPTVPPPPGVGTDRTTPDGFVPLFAETPRALPRTGGVDGAAAALTALAAIIAGLGAWLRGRR
jgi:outer membrane biosynthesis protein TonB